MKPKNHCDNSKSERHTKERNSIEQWFGLTTTRKCNAMATTHLLGGFGCIVVRPYADLCSCVCVCVRAFLSVLLAPLRLTHYAFGRWWHWRGGFAVNRGEGTMALYSCVCPYECAYMCDDEYCENGGESDGDAMGPFDLI